MEVINPWFLYLWTRLDALNFIFGFGGGMLLLAHLFYIPVWGECAVETEPTVIKWFKRTLSASIIMILLFVAIPTKKDAAVIYIIPKIVNNETIQQEAGELYKIAKDALKESFPGQTKESEEK